MVTLREFVGTSINNTYIRSVYRTAFHSLATATMTDRPPPKSSPTSTQKPQGKSEDKNDSSVISEEELERLLNREATALNRELEVERILKAFKLKCVHRCLGLPFH